MPDTLALTAAAPLRRRRGGSAQRLALGLMLASGFAGLGYQIVWTQQAALWLGHEAAAVLAVVTAFFGGLAAGAWLLGPRVERSARPERWYAACEAVTAGWGLLLALAMQPLSQALQACMGAEPGALWQAAVAFGGSLLLLLPATLAMGATLPAMERVLAPQPQAGPRAPESDAGHGIAALYACNTAGAVLGVLATAFWLVPSVGLVRTAALCAVLNVFCAAAALRLARPAAVRHTPRSAGAASSAHQARLGVLAATGLLGIGYELLVVRVLSQVTEDTVFSFAILLAMYLVGTAAGAAAWQRWRGGIAPALLQDRLLLLLAAACLAGGASLWGAELLRGAVQQALGPGMAPALAAEAAVACAAFLLPTVAMGALFSHLSVQARAHGIAFSRSLAVNTLGAATAPLLVGVLLLPALGAKAVLLLIVAAYLALLSRRVWRRPAALLPAAALLGVALWTPPLAFVSVPEGGHVVSYREGVLAAVSVVDDADGVSRLRINNRQQEGSSASLPADARQALLPLLLHPAPRRALFLGLGTGLTAASAAADAALEVDAVELLPEVIAASAHFRQAVWGSAAQPRLHLVAADARRFVRSDGPRYDIIVSDNFHPARSGSGALYTVEHFGAVRARLAEQGLFCQWLPLHQLDLPTLRSIVRSFIAVYPQGAALLATNSLQTPVLGLVSRADGAHFALAPLRQRMAGAAQPLKLAAFGLPDDLALFGSFVAGQQALARFAGSAPLNTDDRPVVAYRAPRVTYAPETLPRERLLALLQVLHAAPGELLDADAAADPAWQQRLAAYWAARDGFLLAGRDVRPTASVQQMLAQVQAPLLAVLRTSPDFRPAYDPLLGMAVALASSDAAAARALLQALVQAQPARPEAAQALRRLLAPPAAAPLPSPAG